MPKPRPYQLAGRDFLASRKVALLADEMRVGKTPQAVLAAHKANASSVLVTCPAIAVPHWHREFEKWWPGAMLPRLKIMSYDRAREWWRSGLSGTVDVFIPDEAHFAKNPEAARTQMVYGKGGFAWRAGATWALSGTPAPKHAGELWPLLRAFGAVGMGYGDFCDRYCAWNAEHTKIIGTRAKYIEELRGILAGVMLRRMRKEVAPELPDIDFQFLEVEPQPLDYQVPTDLSDEQLAEWLEDNQRVDTEDRVAVAVAKAVELQKHIAFAVGNGLLRQTVVFGWHKEPLEMLADQLSLVEGVTAAVINGSTSARDRELYQDLFRRDKLRVLCVNIATAGTAIDLSCADHGYFLEMDWVPGNNVQAANRLISLQKKSKVSIDVVTWRGSTDDRVQKVLLRRVKELATLFDTIKEKK